MAVSLMGPATGLTNSKLAMADATAERVVKGDTFYAGDKNTIPVAVLYMPEV